MKNKSYIILIIIIILLILFIAVYAKSSKEYSLENILIFNLFDNSVRHNYYFEISNNRRQTRNVNLYQTLKIDSLVNEKIAPGTNGEFSITLESTEDVGYKIEFSSLNKKPKNMLFKIKHENGQYDSLEKLSKTLNGKLKKGILKEINIEWEWTYETSEIENIQDTLDGINIKEYNFDINVISSEI